MTVGGPFKNLLLSRDTVATVSISNLLLYKEKWLSIKLDDFEWKKMNFIGALSVLRINLYSVISVEWIKMGKNVQWKRGIKQIDFQFLDSVRSFQIH